MKGRELSRELWAEIRSAYLQENATLAELALKHGIGKSTLMNRASAEKWTALKKAGVAENNDGEINDTEVLRPQVKPKLRVITGGAYFETTEQILDDAILSLSEAMPEARVRSAEACAIALCKLIEARQRLSPPSAVDLAEKAIELGISPTEFMKALQQGWALKQTYQSSQNS